MLLMLILALILFNKHPSDEEARLKQKHDTIASLFNDLNLGHPLLTARVAVAFDPSAILHQRSIESLHLVVVINGGLDCICDHLEDGDDATNLLAARSAAVEVGIRCLVLIIRLLGVLLLHDDEWDLVALGILRESDNSRGDNDGINVILAFLIEGLAFYVATVQQLLQVVLDVKISPSRLSMVAFNSISLSAMHSKSSPAFLKS